LGIPEDGIEQTSTKNTTFPRQGVLIYCLNSVIYLKNSKLDLIRICANDRSEFVDSDVFAYETQNFNYDAKYYLPKIVHWNQLLEFKECIKLYELREEYLIPDATTNDFGVLGL
jgi:iron complex outermembrane receptor protein